MWRIRINEQKGIWPRNHMAMRWAVNRHGAIVEYRERKLAEIHVQTMKDNMMLEVNDWEYEIVEIT